MGTAVRTLELSVLLAATWPALRLVAHPPLRRLFPRVHAAIACGAGLWVALAILVAVRLESALHALALATAVVLSAAFVRARAGSLRPRGLPPGSLSLASSIQAVADRRHFLRTAERLGPIFKVAQFHRPVVCVVGLERTHRLVREHGDSLAPNPLPLARDVGNRFLRYMDDDAYATYGPLFRKAQSATVVEAAEPETVEAAREELARLASDCAGAPAGAVSPGPYLERIVFDALARALFGLSPADDEQARFRTAYAAVAEQGLGAPLGAESRTSLETLRSLVLEREADRRAPPVSVLTELRRVDSRMPDATCVDNLLFTLRFASANVVSLLHWLLAMLGRHPEWAARIRTDADAADRFVLETLRLAQSEYLYRVVTTEFEFEGHRFPPGWLVRLCVWESHRDPDAFRDPETFDPDRFLARSFRSSEYSPFGWGPHACNGVSLTQMICIVVLRTLVEGYRSEVTGDGPAERGFRHWHHWRPPSTLRLGLKPLAGDAVAPLPRRPVAIAATAPRR